jgi:hypothetical protein
MTRAQNLANALYHVAFANHYMVGVTETVTAEEIADARQILIDRQNAAHDADGEWTACELALNIADRPIAHGMTVADPENLTTR